MASLRRRPATPLLALCCILYVDAAVGAALPAWTSSSASGVHRRGLHRALTRRSA